MPRAVSSLVLSFLMVLTLLWGGCISCPQFYMFPGMFPSAAKPCCKTDGTCRRPAKSTSEKECKRISLEPARDSAAQADLATPALPAVALLAPVVEVALAGRQREASVPDDSPPDLHVLHSTFII